MRTPTDGPDEQSNAMAGPPMPADGEAWALFLDVDGTLAPIARTPGDATIPRDVVERVRALHDALDGALALVSGRPIVDVDRMVAPARFPVVGVHGAEWRVAATATARSAAPPHGVDAAREAFAVFVREHAGTLMEDKGTAVALHYRRNAGAGEAAVQLARGIAAAGEAGVEVLQGHMVVEIRPLGVNKGGAVHALLEVAPFAGRRPVYLGDDVTDEDAFTVVNAHGGVSVAVGPRSRTNARYQLASVRHVHDWLGRLARHVRGGPVDE